MKVYQRVYLRKSERGIDPRCLRRSHAKGKVYPTALVFRCFPWVLRDLTVTGSAFRLGKGTGECLVSVLECKDAEEHPFPTCIPLSSTVCSKKMPETCIPNDPHGPVHFQVLRHYPVLPSLLSSYHFSSTISIQYFQFYLVLEVGISSTMLVKYYIYIYPVQKKSRHFFCIRYHS